MTLKDRYGFGGFSGTPPSEPNLSTPPPRGSGRGCPSLRAGEILHLEPEKTVSDAYFGGKLLEYDFLQTAIRGQDDNIKLYACRFR